MIPEEALKGTQASLGIVVKMRYPARGAGCKCPDRFADFRLDTGNASAVQMTSAQTLHVHLLGVRPNKEESIKSAQENLFLTHYMNEHFQPLR